MTKKLISAFLAFLLLVPFPSLAELDEEEDLLIEELIDLNLIGIVLVTLHLECSDDGVLVADCDGSVDVLCRVGHVDKEARTKQELVIRSHLEIDGLLVDLFASELADTSRR